MNLKRYMEDAEARRDVDDHKFYKARKQAFEEIEPNFRQLCDENDMKQSLLDQAYDELDKLRKEFNQLDEAAAKDCDKLEAQAKEIERLREALGRIRKITPYGMYHEIIDEVIPFKEK